MKMINQLSSIASLLIILLMPKLTIANDGDFDANDDFPAVGRIAAITTVFGEVDFVEAYCSGSLIAEDIFLTAGHCQFSDAPRLANDPGYAVEYWVSFDNAASNNDFRCYLQDINHPNKDDVACNPNARNGSTFHKALASVVHPEYDGLLIFQESADLSLLVLETPIDDITPLDVAPLGKFNRKREFLGQPLTAVGYGVNFHKSIPATPGFLEHLATKSIKPYQGC